MKALRFDHVGINVQDLSPTIAFFEDLGLEVQGRMDVEGEWVEKIIALKNVKDTIVMMGLPGGTTMLELVQFHSPLDEQGLQPSHSNTLGLRHLCFEVDDVEGVTSMLKEKHGTELVGVIHNYENLYKLCYVRGPEGIIVELAQKIGAGEIQYEGK